MNLFDNAQSLFDGLREVRGDGTEFWSGRGLQPLMGYGTWERFKNPLERAMASARNQMDDVSRDFRRSAKISGTKPMEDYELSRFAAYLVAMNGDPNKPEVAAAQAYFAIRTREAEAAPVHQEMTEDEIVHRALAITTRKVESLTAKVEELAPAAAAWDSLADAEGDYSLREAAQILSRDPAINTGQNRLAKSLRELGVLDRRGEPYQSHINHVRRRPTAYTHPHTGEPKLSSQLRITVSGLRYMHGKLGGTRPLRLDVETGSAGALA
ncbi:phage antirepressor KilAC domain-containing protein [Prescottella equi]|uniref:phage antirepressor KilAC domain-containing protein n=1 Tax=Rhodococcus hoagii TaxID=43767 RepID=UPI001EED1243|nr:phage antirepressor KilAC domain-containing protein [Prescottella equi]